MACMDACCAGGPDCRGWKPCHQYACDDCNGVNAGRSYTGRTSNLAACLRFAALEEMRTRYVLSRIRAAEVETPLIRTDAEAME